jgi:putative oxidoreductase
MRNDDLGKLILRLTVAVLMLFHGVYKLQHGIAWMAEPLGEFGLPFFVGYGVFVAEIIAPLLIILGYGTRLAALLIAFDMVMAILLVQRAKLFAVNGMSGAWGVEIEMFFLLTSVAIFFFGGGKYRFIPAKTGWD